MAGRLAALIAAAAVAALGVAFATADSPFSDDALAVAAAERFLDRYVAADGRVVRRDQGGDTVSEGQAYAMLLALAVGDERRFDRAWTWARRNLLRPEDGLMAYLWRDGAIADRGSATDADLDAAQALLLGAVRFGEPRYRRDGLALARAILDHTTATVNGRLVLTAGSWATGAPPTVNVSYLSPGAFAALGTLTGDERWGFVRTWAQQAVRDVVADGRLPPNWAKAEADGSLRPVGAPDESGEAQYGLDAQRVPVRFAAACDPDARAVARGMWPRLQTLTEPRIAHALDGTVRDDRPNALGYVAQAAAAPGAATRDGLLGEADALARAAPTYYGDAWLALGRVWLTTGRLGACDRR